MQEAIPCLSITTISYVSVHVLAIPFSGDFSVICHHRYAARAVQNQVPAPRAFSSEYLQRVAFMLHEHVLQVL